MRVCVCVCVCLQVNHPDVIRLGVKVDQGLSCVHPQVEWQVTLRTLDGSQTLFLSWSPKTDNRRDSEGDLVLRDGNSGRLDLVKDQVG